MFFECPAMMSIWNGDDGIHCGSFLEVVEGLLRRATPLLAMTMAAS